jgi:hypothetical protein
LNDRVYPGLDVDKFNVSKRESDSEKPIVKPDLIPYIYETGWTMDDYHELRK